MTTDDIAAINNFIYEQRLRDPSPIAAIKEVRERFQVGLGTAKHLVESHPAWFSIVDANRPLQEIAEQILTQADLTQQ